MWNTIFGYLAFLALYQLVAGRFSYMYILLPAQCLGILNAYVCHRTFVFDDASHGLLTFLRYNMVIWILFVINLFALPALSSTGLDPRIAQAGLTFASATSSYFAHLFFSFKKSAPAVAGESDGRA